MRVGAMTFKILYAENSEDRFKLLIKTSGHFQTPENLIIIIIIIIYL